jgi:hypothetical protein
MIERHLRASGSGKAPPGDGQQRLSFLRNVCGESHEPNDGLPALDDAGIERAAGAVGPQVEPFDQTPIDAVQRSNRLPNPWRVRQPEG